LTGLMFTFFGLLTVDFRYFETSLFI
jgi:hypothetical protein